MADKGTKILPGLRDAARAAVDNLVADKGTKILPWLRERVQRWTILVADKNHLEVFFSDRQGP